MDRKSTTALTVRYLSYVHVWKKYINEQNTCKSKEGYTRSVLGSQHDHCKQKLTNHLVSIIGIIWCDMGVIRVALREKRYSSMKPQWEWDQIETLQIRLQISIAGRAFNVTWWCLALREREVVGLTNNQ